MMTSCRSRGRRWTALCVALAATAAGSPARADMVLSQVIVDLRPGGKSSDDIEVWNDGPDRLYVVADPFEIRDPGSVSESRTPARDPGSSGILVSPQRLILEAGERRVVRIAAILPRAAADRVYRVTIKPVTGQVSASADALKVYVGYDVLVLQRPATLMGGIEARREGNRLIVENTSNTAWEVFDGRQCRADGQACAQLPARRLYARERMEVALPYATKPVYKATNGVETRALIHGE